ncbi:MAG: MBL fold metallo-hydrolase [Chitinophagales bacterium]
MKITFLGTGTSMGVPMIACNCEACTSSDMKDKRLRVSVLIEQENRNLLIDCGPDFRQQMMREQVTHVDAILFTHEHNDHVAGLDDVRPFTLRQKRDMPLYAKKRVLDWLKSRYSYAFGPKKYAGSPSFELHTIDKDIPFSVNGFEVIPIEVIHGKLPILGFRIGSFTYLTDVKYMSETEKAKVQGSETIVISALRRNAPHWSHLNLPEALALLEEWQPKRAFITHLSHRMGKHKDIQQLLPPYVKVAYDGLVLEV